MPDARASWARDESLHLTLKFLGNIPTRSITNLSAAAAKAVAGISPFSIRLESAGAFPKPGQPRVLWIGIQDKSGELHQLQAQLESQAALAGFQKEAREFRPHLTVARLRNPQHARELAASHLQMNFEAMEMEVSELLVIRSELSSKGSKYTVISRHAL